MMPYGNLLLSGGSHAPHYLLAEDAGLSFTLLDNRSRVDRALCLSLLVLPKVESRKDLLAVNVSNHLNERELVGLDVIALDEH